MCDLIETKEKIKNKGYSVVTIYTPKKEKIEIQILKGTKHMYSVNNTEEECLKYLNFNEKTLIKIN